MSTSAFTGATAIVKEVYNNLGPPCTGNITVVYDGPWKSLLTDWCRRCDRILHCSGAWSSDSFELLPRLGNGPKPIDATYRKWKKHHQCQKNTDVKAVRMEADAALLLFTRCPTLCGLRYTTVISDGDSTTFKTFSQENAYGMIPIQKEECINHVANCVGFALRECVETEKNQKPMGGKRCLTQNLIMNLSSWRRLLVSHPPHVTTAMLPIFQRLSEPGLLKRCLGTKPQNAAELVHFTIWTILPQT